MSDRYLEDPMEELAYDEAEGSSEGYDEAEEYETEAGEEGDEFLRGLLGNVARVAGGLIGGGGDGAEEDGYEEDGYDESDEMEAADEWDEGADEIDEFGEEVEEDSLEAAVADALEEEDTDEFFRRIANIARSVGRGVGQVARVVAPIASAIPIPQAQAIGRIAGVVGRVLADGADESDALEDLFEFAEAEDSIDAAAPVIAAMTLRQRMPGVARAPQAVRRQLVRGVTQATRTLARRQGPAAARAVPGVVRQVQQGIRRRAVPPRRAAQTVRQVAQRVARSPRAVRALAHRARATAPHGRRHRRHHRRHGHHHGHIHGHVHGRHHGHRHPHFRGRPRPVGAARPVGVPGATGTTARAGGCNCPVCRPARSYTLRGPVRITIQGR